MGYSVGQPMSAVLGSLCRTRKMSIAEAGAGACNTCGMFAFLPEDVGSYTCSQCKLIALPDGKVQQVEVCLSVLQFISKLKAPLVKS